MKRLLICRYKVDNNHLEEASGRIHYDAFVKKYELTNDKANDFLTKILTAILYVLLEKYKDNAVYRFYRTFSQKNTVSLHLI